ncbi:MAG: hypothetical protein PHW24_03585, partial [Candidatus Moranbacteria bacterium]|nr:hypothetical protein [Candidatus Moranbacteria bacterium]
MQNYIFGIGMFVNKNRALVFLLCMAFFVWMWMIFLRENIYVDEGYHTRQIHRFMKGNYEIIPALTTIPGYHAVIAFIANAFDISSLKQIRVVSLLLS